MERQIERGCGLDVHRTPWRRACACRARRASGSSTCGPSARRRPSCGALRDWLDAHGVTHVAMESTGVYWKPVFYVLEDQRSPACCVNAAHIKQVPGRKTDVLDCVWIAQLLEHGLLRGSFVPPVPIRRAPRPDPVSQGRDPGPAAGRQPTAQAAPGCGHQAGARWPRTSSGCRTRHARGLVHGTTDPGRPCRPRARPAARETAGLAGGAGRTVPSPSRLSRQPALAHLDHLDEAITDREHGGGERTSPLSRRHADAVGHDPRRRAADGGGPHRRDRRGHEPASRAIAISPSWAGLCPGNHERAASTGPGRPGKATAGCGWPSSKPPRPPFASRTVPWRPATGACGDTADTRKPSSRWPTPSCASSTICWSRARPIAILAPTTTIAIRLNGSPAARSRSGASGVSRCPPGGLTVSGQPPA